MKNKKKRIRIATILLMCFCFFTMLIPTSQNSKTPFFTVVEAANGTWMHDSTGYWYKHADGTYTKSDWEKIDGDWYYFNAKGYMVTGWQTIGGKTLLWRI